MNGAPLASTAEAPGPQLIAPGTGAALLAVVALAGAATMVVELGAVRLIAPWFGTSSAVWTNVIGVVLAALALGYALGARLALGADPVARLGAVLLSAGAFSAWLPMATAHVAGWFMPDGVPLHGAAGALVWGSLATSLVLFLPTAAALGTAGPLAVEALQRLRGGSAGAAGGRVLACSTLGSLAGTFGTTHFFVPSFGIARSFVVAAALLGASGLLLLFWRRRARSPFALAALLALCAGAAFDSFDAGLLRRDPAPGERLLAHVESNLQSLRVVETGEGEGLQRRLTVNESLDSFQSLWVPEPGLLPQGHYYNHFALPYAWTARELGEAPEVWRMLVIGLGAGTAVRVLEGVVDPATDFESLGIELDPEVIRLGRAHFELAPEGSPNHAAVGGLDGRAALRLTTGEFDEIVVDAYANNMEIPPHLATVEAFARARSRLAEGGWLAVNVGGFDAEDPVLRAVGASVARAFAPDGGASAARVPFSRNWIVFARRGRPVPTPGSSSFGARGTRLAGGVDALVRSLEAPGAWLDFPPDAPGLLTDDASPTEALQTRSIERASEHVARVVGAARELAAAGPARGEPAPDADDIAREATIRGLMAREEYVDALDAASEVGRAGLRTALEAEVLWAAGAPFEALDAALGTPALAADSARVLRLVARIAVSLGETEIAAAATERLASVVDAGADDSVAAAPAWWDAELGVLRSLAGPGGAAGEGRALARRRAQGAVAGALVIALLALLAAARVRPPSALV